MDLGWILDGSWKLFIVMALSARDNGSLNGVQGVSGVKGHGVT
jgi:hypothetical protein